MEHLEKLSAQSVGKLFLTAQEAKYLIISISK